MKPIFAWLALVVCAGGVTSVQAATSGAPRENVDYTIVRPTQPSSAAKGRVEVIEFFGYWCPACNAFEPVLDEWVARHGAQVDVRYVPAPTHFRAGQADFQKFYYALDAMGLEKSLRPKVFAALHAQHSLADTANVDALADWVAKNGVDRKKFVDTFNSFAVQAKVARANQMIATYGLTATPSLGIGGRFLLTVDARSIGKADVLLARTLAEQ